MCFFARDSVLVTAAFYLNTLSRFSFCLGNIFDTHSTTPQPVPWYSHYLPSYIERRGREMSARPTWFRRSASDPLINFHRQGGRIILEDCWTVGQALLSSGVIRVIRGKSRGRVWGDGLFWALFLDSGLDDLIA